MIEKYGSSKKGVGLIDVLVALFILSSFLSLFMGLISLKNYQLDTVESHMVACNGVVDKIETLKSSPGVPHSQEFTVKDLPESKGKVEIQKIEKGLFQVLVEITWKDHRGIVQREWGCTYLQR